MKKYIFVLLIIATLFLSACGSKTTINSNGEVLGINENYIKYSADSSCKLLMASTEGDVMVAMQEAMNFEEYDLTVEDVEKYNIEYENNEEVALLILEEMKNICGDKLKEMGINEIPQQ
ncbi:MAG: hypothetical protein AB7V77_00890 [Candidatus Woesearchaeota archaeon]